MFSPYKNIFTVEQVTFKTQCRISVCQDIMPLPQISCLFVFPPDSQMALWWKQAAWGEEVELLILICVIQTLGTCPPGTFAKGQLPGIYKVCLRAHSFSWKVMFILSRGFLFAATVSSPPKDVNRISLTWAAFEISEVCDNRISPEGLIAANYRCLPEGHVYHPSLSPPLCAPYRQNCRTSLCLERTWWFVDVVIPHWSQGSEEDLLHWGLWRSWAKSLKY